VRLPTEQRLENLKVPASRILLPSQQQKQRAGLPVELIFFKLR
jgi:hypothetical protein